MNPATGSVYAHLPNSVPEDVEAAVSSAEAAYPAWSSLSHEARAPVLLRCGNIVKRLYSTALAMIVTVVSAKDR